MVLCLALFLSVMLLKVVPFGLPNKRHISFVLFLSSISISYFNQVHIYTHWLILIIKPAIPAPAIYISGFKYQLTPTVKYLHIKFVDTLTQFCSGKKVIIFSVAIRSKSIWNIRITIFSDFYFISSAASQWFCTHLQAISTRLQYRQFICGIAGAPQVMIGFLRCRRQVL